MVAVLSITSIQLVCFNVIVIVLLYQFARRTWRTQQHQQQSSLDYKLIQQRDDVSRRLNNLQVKFYL